MSKKTKYRTFIDNTDFQVGLDEKFSTTDFLVEQRSSVHH